MYLHINKDKNLIMLNYRNCGLQILNANYLFSQARFERSEIIKEWEESKREGEIGYYIHPIMTYTACVHCGCLSHTNIVVTFRVSPPNNSLWSKE